MSAYDILMADLLLMEKDSAQYDVTLPLGPVRTAVEALKPRRPVIHRYPVRLDRVVTLDAFYPGWERYNRANGAGGARHLCLTQPSFSLKFWVTNVTRGGSPDWTFAYPNYDLWFQRINPDGTLAARDHAATAKPTGRGGTFVGTLLADWPDGPLLATIEPWDAAGAPVVDSVESYVPFVLWTDLHGTAKDRPDFIIQTGDVYELIRSNPDFMWAQVPKSLARARPRPLVKRVPIPFSTPLPKDKLVRINYVDPREGNLHRPVVTSRGIMTAENRQSYFWSDLVQFPHPTLPMLDGPRGVCTSASQTAMLVGRNFGLYVMDGWALSKIDATGFKTTLGGFRHAVAPYWEEAQKGVIQPEIVGDWDASIPMSQRYPYESWGMAWDERTTVQGTGAPIGEPPEPPHDTNPVLFSVDRFGRVLRWEFNGKDRSVAPKISALVTGLSDPWGIACRGGVIYTTERLKHRISKWSADTGAYLGDVLAIGNGASLGFLNPTGYGIGRRWDRFSGVTQAQVRAMPICAPEGLALMNDWLYFSSYAQSEVRRVSLTTGAVEVVCRPSMSPAGKSVYLVMAVSDGSFGPRHTVFTSSWSESYWGRPEAFYPATNLDLTHSKWDYTGFVYDVRQGGGGKTESAGYATAPAVGHGMFACGSAQDGIAVFMQKEPTDITADPARCQRGATWFRSQGYRLLYDDGAPLLDLDMPWGENADCDHWMQYGLGMTP
jgi:hypothetical protein